MATKRKSIIEEALLEAKTLEDALKANTKEMLANHMKQEIETIVETSLKAGDVDDEGSDEENEGPVTEQEIEDDEDLVVLAGDDSEEAEDIDIDIDDIEADEEESELDLDLDADDIGAEEGEIELDISELPIDLGGEGELDLTASSDEEVLTVFKAMSDEDEVEVVKDGDGIYLTDNETGAEYYIKESEQLDEDGLCEGCGSHVDEDEDLVYEIELDEHQGYDDEEDESLGMRRGPERDYRQSFRDRREDSYGKRGKRDIEDRGISLEEDDDWGSNEDEYKRTSVGGVKTRSGDVGGGKYGKGGHYKDYELDEDLIQRHQEDGYQRKSGAKVGSNQANPYGGRYSESRRSRKPISNKRKGARNVRKVNDSKIMKEYKELKSKNEEYKGALKVFKDKLNEVALFNTNLAYVNRLFTEHSTTKKEKMSILKRFDGAEGVKESKSIYKSIKEELEGKSPITESIENKVNRTVKSSASDLNESTAYVDPQIMAIKDLMRRIS